MKLTFLCMLVFSQQLTWYELYERGEKYFKKGEYQRCIDDMDEALASKPLPRRNQFTRAVQKIDYKPFYYKALAYFELGDLPSAYQYARAAFQGDVVANSPPLQSGLGEILQAYRSHVQDFHQRFTRERRAINERNRLLELLRDGRLEEVKRELESLESSEGFQDIITSLELQEEYYHRLSVYRGDVLKQIEDWLSQGEDGRARELFDTLKDSLPIETVRLLEQRFQAMPSEIPEPESGADGGGDREPEEKIDYPAIIDAFNDRLKSLEQQNAKSGRMLGRVQKQNRILQGRLQARQEGPAPFIPKLLLVLKRKGFDRILVEGDAVSPMLVKHWLLSLNGKALAVPASALKVDGSAFRLEHSVRAPFFGEHTIRFSLVDETGNSAFTEKEILIPLPFYLSPRFWMFSTAAVLVLILLLFLVQGLRRKRALLRHFNPYIAGSPVRAAAMFYGRDELMQRIQGLVHNNSFMIHGDRRIGKTSLLLQLRKNLSELRSERYAFYPAFIDLQGIREEDLFHHMMAELLPQAAEWDISRDGLGFREEAQGYQSRHFSKDIKKLIQRLGEKNESHVVVVLLVDEVDVLNEFGEKTNQKLRGIFMKDFAEHLTCVMAGIHLKKEWESSGSPWYNFFEEIPVKPFDEAFARDLILQPVKGIFKYKKNAVELIISQTACHPYLIQKVCVSVIGEKLKSNRFVIGRADVANALNNLQQETKRNQPL